MADQSEDTTKVQLGEPMSFIGVTYRNAGERLPMGAETIKKKTKLSHLLGLTHIPYW